MHKKILEIQDVYAQIFKLLRRGFRPQVSCPIKKAEAITLIEIKKKPLLSMNHYMKVVDKECGSFTYIANKLEQKGLILRVQETHDQRISRLDLTSKGRAVTDELEHQFIAHLNKRTECLNAHDIKTMEAAAKILENILEKLRHNT